MSITKGILFGAGASWFSRGMAILLSLILLPILFRNLSKEELGLWILLAQSWATLGILDFGFGVTLTRRIAFAKGKSGSNPDVLLTEESNVEIADLMEIARRIYFILAIVAFLISFTLGVLYLKTLTFAEVSFSTIIISWALLCLSFALTTLATPWTSLLQGVGFVGWNALLASFVSSLTLIVQIIAVLFGGGLIALATVAIVGALAQRFLFLIFARRKRPEIFNLRGEWCGQTFREMKPLAARAWLTAIGSTLILYTDQFIIALNEGIVELPAYRAAWLLIHNVTIISVTLSAASEVFISHLWQTREIDQIHRVLVRNLRVGWLITLGLATLLIVSASSIFELWLGPGNFIGIPIILAFLFTEALEVQTYTIVSSSRATGAESYSASYLCAGILKLSLSLWLASILGLIGVALGTAFALLLTNHWFIPWHGLKRLRYPYRDLFRKVIVPCYLAFGVPALLVFSLAKTNLEAMQPFLQLVISSALIACILLPSVWFLILEPSQRNLIRKRLLSRS